MPFWTKKSDAKRFRLFFATDVHGSEPTFRKFINAGKYYDVDALILGGDITGKLLVPIIDLGDERYRATLQSNTRILNAAEVPEFETRLAKLGFYSSTMSEADFLRISDHPDEVNQLFFNEGEGTPVCLDALGRGKVVWHSNPLLRHRRQRRFPRNNRGYPGRRQGPGCGLRGKICHPGR